jgi:dTDP-glucose pyrophosphorylase
MQNNWTKAVLRSDATIEDALKAIDAGAMRIAFVTDADGKLLGTLSDGDIRRALIDRMPLTETVAKIMNRAPRKASSNDSRSRVRAMMQSNDLLVVPLVDDSGHIVGVHHLREVIGPAYREISVFLMAGGFGTRLRPLTDDCPKPMLKLGDKPILENTVEKFVAAGFRKFYISVHYLPHVIMNYFEDGRKWGADIEYIQEDSPLGTAGAISLLPKSNGHPVIMMNGDVVTSVDFNALLASHIDKGAALTMCVREHHLQVPYGVVESDGHNVVDVIEKPTHKFFVNAGIYVLSEQVFEYVGVRERIDMPDLIRKLVAANKRVSMFPIHEHWLDIGRFDDFDRAARESI